MSKYIFLKKKIILGKTKKIYTKKGSKKEYVKYKNRMINVAKYKKIKNYNSKKMKGGAKGPGMIKRTRLPRTAPVNRQSYVTQKNLDNIIDNIREFKLSEPKPHSQTTIRFGANKVKIIPSREELLYRDKLKHFIIKKSRTSQGTHSRRSERRSHSRRSERRSPSRRSPSRRSERPPSRRPPSILRRSSQNFFP